MAVTAPHRRRVRGRLVLAVVVGAVAVSLSPLLLILLGLSGVARQSGCDTATSGASGGISLLGPGAGGQVGATEYGGPGDPSSGDVGSSGVDLDTHPDSYAELGGVTFQTATALGGLSYETPLRITWGGHSVIAYKRDIGLGGGPIDGRPREIDLWWELAGALRIPYEDGEWSGVVRLERPPATGAADVLGESVAVADSARAASAEAADTGGGGSSGGATDTTGGGATDTTGGGGTGTTGTGGTGTTGAGCTTVTGVSTLTPVTSGPRAQLLADGQAAAPASAPVAVKGIIAAGNEIVGKPYVYGGGHGIPLDEVASSYDCSSSMAHLLWGGGLLPVDDDLVAADFMTWGEPGPGRWVTIYASPDHVFAYIAGLRWDTHNAAGPDDGSTGIGWHPLIRESEGFVVRHPVGL